MLEALREIVPLYILQSHKTPNHSLWVKRREFLILKLLVGLYIVTAVFETVNFIYIITSVGCPCFVHETYNFFFRVCLIHLSLRFHSSCRHLPEDRLHSSVFLHWSGSKFLVDMAACTTPIHVSLGRPLFLLSIGVNSVTNFGILSSGILLTWPYHCNLFFSMMSMMSCFPFTPIFPLYVNF